MIAAVEGDRILVKGSDTYANRAVLAALEGARWDPARKAWAYPVTPVAAHNLARLGSAVESRDGVAELLTASAERLARLARMREGDEPPIYTDGLWRHQRAAVHVARLRGGVLLEYGMRSGKTRISLTIAEINGYRRVLIVCPKKVIDTWPEQAAEHGIALRVTGLTKGSTAAKLRAAERTPGALAINYESVWRQPFGAWALEESWDLLILDEVHRCGAPGGKASTYLARLAARVPHRIGLSGTPVGDSPVNAYGVFRALDAGVFGTSFAKFKARYVVEREIAGGIRIPVGFRDKDKFNARYNLITLKGDRAQSDMPDELDSIMHCDLSGAAKALYASMRDELIAELESGTITADNALVKAAKLHQLAAGHVKHLDGRVEHVHHEKDELLAEVLAELDPAEPLVVFCWFRADLTRIHEVCRAAGRPSLEVSGSRDDLAAWRDGEGNVLAVQIQAGGVGVDLSRGGYAVFWTACFSLTLMSQARARLLGQQRPVSFTHLVTRHTIDEAIYRAHERKGDILDEMLAEAR